MPPSTIRLVSLTRPSALLASVRPAKTPLLHRSLPRSVTPSASAAFHSVPALRSAAPEAPSPAAAGLPALEFVKVTFPAPGVGQITLHRPKALNALSTPLITDLNAALAHLDAAPSIGAIVLTGSARAFAAGADIKEMSTLSFADAYLTDFIERWHFLPTSVRKPVVAAVNGHALGGGCELALMCDIVYAGKTASFGQPEIALGVVPGAGGSQRLTRAVGKARAMELILTGERFSGAQAAEWGVAAKAFETPEECVEGAVRTAAKIASFSRVAVKAAKEVVNWSQEVGLRDGVAVERRVFHSLFGSKDQKIGMEAFANKKKPEWSNE